MIAAFAVALAVAAALFATAIARESTPLLVVAVGFAAAAANGLGQGIARRRRAGDRR